MNLPGNSPPHHPPAAGTYGLIRRVLMALGVLLVVMVAVLVLWALRQGGGDGLRQALTTGEIRELQPAVFQTAPLRTNQGGADRVYLLSIQSETITTIPSRRQLNPRRRDLLYVDLWAVDAATTTLAWRIRLRSFEDNERAGRDFRLFDLLGVDGETLWLTAEGPLGVSLATGEVVADGAAIDAKNPNLAGRRVDDLGYVAFGRHGLQVTLNDASQWRIDASDLSAAPRDTPVRNPQGIVPPASYARGANSTFMTRALPLGNRWLGLLTEEEAEHYRHKPVVAGRDPDERPGAMQQFLEANHVPSPLYSPELKPYRLWSAEVAQVSAAPPDWPSELPDKWGTRPEFSNYTPLPDAPTFLRAGLLREHRQQEQALWYRQPDSVLVLHPDKLGAEGRLQLSRVAGPAGNVVWSTGLGIDELQSVMRSDHDLMLLGNDPTPASASGSSPQQDPHLVLLRIDVTNGTLMTLDMTAQSLQHFE